MPEVRTQTGTNPRSGAPIYSTTTYKKKSSSARGKGSRVGASGDPNLGQSGTLKGTAKALSVFPNIDSLKIKKNK